MWGVQSTGGEGHGLQRFYIASQLRVQKIGRNAILFTYQIAPQIIFRWPSISFSLTPPPPPPPHTPRKAYYWMLNWHAIETWCDYLFSQSSMAVGLHETALYPIPSPIWSVLSIPRGHTWLLAQQVCTYQ